MAAVFPYDRSRLLTLKNPDFVKEIERFVVGAYESDVGHGDCTTEILANRHENVEAVIVAKEAGIFCGEPVIRSFVQAVAPKVRVVFNVKEGKIFKKGQKVMILGGDAAAVLKLERTLLNVLSRLCGIATTTSRLARVAAPCRIAATRKTLYGLLDKYAVAVGGGLTHRLHLGDAPLFKENHWALLSSKNPALFSKSPFITIEVENSTQAHSFLKALPSRLPCPIFVMLDNFSVAQLKTFLKGIKPRSELYFEASGGITEKNLKSYAKTGVDVLSLGALTHSVRGVDFSLLLRQ
jgi:nicotinate-nucleotide pyrophosphorylase (carboxylating)